MKNLTPKQTEWMKKIDDLQVVNGEGEALAMHEIWFETVKSQLEAFVLEMSEEIRREAIDECHEAVVGMMNQDHVLSNEELLLAEPIQSAMNTHSNIIVQDLQDVFIGLKKTK